jgi:hypothetical protein
MSGMIKKVLCSESGQGATEYMLFLVLSVTLSMIGFLLVPGFTEGFNQLLSRILGGSYYLSDF